MLIMDVIYHVYCIFSLLFIQGKNKIKENKTYQHHYRNVEDQQRKHEWQSMPWKACDEQGRQ
jgi:hypothetical protein